MGDSVRQEEQCGGERRQDQARQLRQAVAQAVESAFELLEEDSGEEGDPFPRD